MHIVFHSTYATPDRRANAGQTLDIPRDEAELLIAGGYASPTDEPESRRRRPEDVDHDPASEPGPGDDLSKGTVDEVIARVGTDFEAAAVALLQEQAKKHPRSTLVAALTEIITPVEETPPSGDAAPPGVTPPSPPPMVGTGSSRAAWAEYAVSVGLEIADSDNKAAIVAKVKAA